VLQILARAEHHLVHRDRVGPARQRGELRLAHFRRSDHLHGLRDLLRVLDGANAPSNIAGAGHELKALLPYFAFGLSDDSAFGLPTSKVCLNSVSAVFNSAARGSL